MRSPAPSQCRRNAPTRAPEGSCADTPPNQQSAGPLHVALFIGKYGSPELGGAPKLPTTSPSLNRQSVMPSPMRGLLGALTVQNSVGPAHAIRMVSVEPPHTVLSCFQVRPS